ncbi:MAG: hypothetical protein RLZZ203_2079, partial [Cyanobacteriota bacterium]
MVSFLANTARTARHLGEGIIASRDEVGANSDRHSGEN